MDSSQKILSDIVIWSKYAKYIPEINRRETWDEICDRNMAMHVKKYPFLKDELKKVYRKFIKPKKVLPSMRSMQFAGLPIEVNNTRIFNCCYFPINHTTAFAEAMFLLLGGSGVGYSVQKHHVDELPVVCGPSDKRRTYLIGDSIIGWADAVKVLIRAYTEGKSDPVFDYRDIRPKGALLITAGGKAPGPDPLRICLDQIRSILNTAIGRKLTTLEVHDILCHIADSVLSGGIRRAAMIAFFSHDDLDMVSCKSGMWWVENPQRGRANNSAVLERDKITKAEFDELWTRIKESGSGEPGVYFTNDREVLSNPCVSGDALITVCDHGVNGGLGIPYSIPMKLLVEMCSGTTLYPCALSYNENTGVYEWKQITNAMITKHNAKMVKVTDTETGYSVKVTLDHKIFTKNRGWVEAQHLLSDDVLLLIHTDAGIINIEFLDETETVYDITVDDNHNFFADGILVHNCVEATLNPFSFCNLTESNVSDIVDQDDFNERCRAAAFIGTVQASYTDFHYLRPIWKTQTEEDALLGVSMTGISSLDMNKINITEGAKIVVEENARVAALLGIKPAARTTLTKPSGTASSVLGTSSGIHAWHNDFYIRRIRIGKNEALYPYIKKTLPNLIEDCHFKPHLDSVLSLPQKAPEGSILRHESAIDLLNRVIYVSCNWIHPGHNRGIQRHNVSCTISVKDHEWKEVGEFMWDNRYSYNGVAVLPYDGGNYIQAPFEDTDEQTYNDMMKLLHDFDISNVVEIDDNTSHTLEAACAGGQCSV